jgi:uncharacterized peroxidase-related enzyme
VAWIRTVPPEEADERLRKALADQHVFYSKEYDEPVQGLDDGAPGIVAAHTLIPDALYHAFATFGSLMAPDLPLDRRQHEMIATVVSRTNGCHYCTESHTEFLRRVTLDDSLARAIRDDLGNAPIPERDRIMLEYATKLTKDATRISPQDHERLRGAGFDDRAILQITLIAAWFNYINRVADALGVGREPKRTD